MNKHYMTEEEYKKEVDKLIRQLKIYESKRDVIDDKIEQITDELHHLYERTVVITGADYNEQ